MIELLKSRLDKFLGRGHAAVTVPSLDGALKPNNKLEEAAAGVSGQSTDNLALFAGNIIWSEGATLRRGEEGGVWKEMTSEVTAMAALSDQLLAISLAKDGLILLDQSGEEKQRISSADLLNVTALSFVDAETLIVAIGSTRNSLQDWQKDLLEQKPSGQLIKLDLKSGGTTILRDNLAYPSGVCVMPNGQLLVCEAWKARLVEMALDGSHMSPIFEDLPAYPGRIVPSAEGGYWLVFFAPRSPLIEFVLREPAYRKAMMEEIEPEFWIAPALRSGYSFHEPLQGGALKQMGILKPWAPTRSYGLVLELNDRFVPLRSFHSRAGGRRHGITSILPSGQKVWLTSKGGNETFHLNISETVAEGEG
jgi:hypothetical protein